VERSVINTDWRIFVKTNAPWETGEQIKQLGCNIGKEAGIEATKKEQAKISESDNEGRSHKPERKLGDGKYTS